QQTGHVRVLGGYSGIIDVGRGHAQFFGVEHGEQGPSHDVETLFVALANGQTVRHLGDDFRKYHVVVRVGQLDALRVQLRLVGGQHVATTGFDRLGALVGGIVGDGGVLHAIGTEVVGEVQFGGGTGLDADGGAVQFLGAGNPQLLVHQEALTVVVGHAGEVQAQCRIARAGPGGVARQDVDFAGLQRGEALLGGQRAVLALAGVTEDRGCNSAADVDVQTQVV